jgi:ribonuclease HII
MMCGLDEAGRGSVMGPLVVGAVFAESDDGLREMGARDSKKLTPKARARLYGEITSGYEWRVVVASAAEIDARMGLASLNDIEADMFAEAASGSGADVVYADCPDVNEDRFSRAMTARLGVRTVAEHGADDSRPIVSAASIVAKVTRDRMMAEIWEELGADAGSGYPGDARTMGFIEKWIREHGSAPEHARRSWEPVRRLTTLSKASRLSDW